jgi:hypothetical protein
VSLNSFYAYVYFDVNWGRINIPDVPSGIVYCSEWRYSLSKESHLQHRWGKGDGHGSTVGISKY